MKKISKMLLSIGKTINKNRKDLVFRLSIVGTGLFLSTTNVFAAGVDEQAFKDLIDSFLNPLKNSILYAIPAAAVIAIAIMAMRNFFKNEEQKEEFDLIGKIIKTGIIAGLAQSAALVLKIFGVV